VPPPPIQPIAEIPTALLEQEAQELRLDFGTDALPFHEQAAEREKLPGSAGCVSRDRPGVDDPVALLPKQRGHLSPIALVTDDDADTVTGPDTPFQPGVDAARAGLQVQNTLGVDDASGTLGRRLYAPSREGSAPSGDGDGRGHGPWSAVAAPALRPVFRTLIGIDQVGIGELTTGPLGEELIHDRCRAQREGVAVVHEDRIPSTPKALGELGISRQSIAGDLEEITLGQPAVILPRLRDAVAEEFIIDLDFPHGSRSDQGRLLLDEATQKSPVERRHASASLRIERGHLANEPLAYLFPLHRPGGGKQTRRGELVPHLRALGQELHGEFLRGDDVDLPQSTPLLLPPQESGHFGRDYQHPLTASSQDLGHVGQGLTSSASSDRQPAPRIQSRAPLSARRSAGDGDHPQLVEVDATSLLPRRLAQVEGEWVVWRRSPRIRGGRREQSFPSGPGQKKRGSPSPAWIGVQIAEHQGAETLAIEA
jgi:hypothetical protein